MRLLIILMIVLTATSALSTDYTATANGNWNDAATWGGAGYPQAGDTATINNNITVTVPLGITAVAGLDDGATVAIKCASPTGNGALVVYGTLQFRGNVEQCAATWTVGSDGGATAQGRLEHAGASNNYTWQIGMSATSISNSKLLLTGSGRGSGRVVVTNAAGAARFGGFTQGYTVRVASTYTYSTGTEIAGAGKIDAQWVAFESLGVTNDWLTTNLQSGHLLRFQDCLITDCTGLGITNIDPAASFQFLRSSILAPTVDVSLYIRRSSGTTVDAPSTGVREIIDSVISGTLSTKYMTITSAERSIFYSGLVTPSMNNVSSLSTNFTSMVDCLIWNRTNAHSNMPTGAISRMISVKDSTEINIANTDHFRFIQATNATNTTFSGPVIESGYYQLTSGDAAFIFSVGSANSLTFAVSGALDVPHHTDANKPSNKSLITPLTATSTLPTLAITNVTKSLGDPTTVSTNMPWILACEATPGRVGLVTAFTNNLAYRSASGIGTIIHDAGSTATPVDGAFNGVDYNYRYNVTNTYFYHPATAKFTSPSPPGPNDGNNTGDLAALFFRHGANMLKWAQQFKPSLTAYSGIIAELIKKNSDTGFDSRFNHVAYYNWIRDAYTPIDMTLATACNGTYCGAVTPNQPAAAAPW